MSLVKQRPQEELRKELLSLKGVGYETADCLLIYVFHKPSFIIYPSSFNMQGCWLWMEQRLLADAELFNEFHALIIMQGKRHCSAKPKCLDCPLEAYCAKRIA